MDLEPGSIVDRYSVVGELGQGGMASVYHVRHTRLSSDHVLKVLTLPGRSIRERLLLEGQVQARLKHKNVVEVTDVIEIRGAPGLVMELVRGQSLDDVLRNRRLPLEIVEKLVPGILAGVAAAHHEGVVHRDLKPANILLAIKRGRVTPKVADFGLVKIVDEDPNQAKTRTNATMGTPQYMAPEQIQNAKNVDARADIFALGAILYELVTGRRAFDGESQYEIFQRVVERTHVPLTELMPDAPERYAKAIDAALADADDRPPTAEELWDLWRDEDMSLEEAASRASSWPDDLLQQLKDLAPSVITLSDSALSASAVSAATSGANSGGAHSSETYVAELPDTPVAPAAPSAPTVDVPPEPVPAVAPAELPPAPARGNTPVVAFALLAGFVVVGVVFLVGFGASLFVISTPVEVETPVAVPVDPIPLAPMPAIPAPPDPAPVAPVPVSPAPPIPDPAPAPARPAPRPTPAPAPSPSPSPAPEVSASGTVEVLGGVSVSLIGADQSAHGPGKVPAGKYQVRATFESGPLTLGSIDIAEGSTTTIRCRAELSNCTW